MTGKQSDATAADVLIIGFGFSMIPLLRELDREERSYTIICDKNSVWDRLHDAGRLDFDLVSSYYSSFYSFELAERSPGDGFPTAREFHALQQRYFRIWCDRIVDGFVELVRNFPDHSIVQTRDGRTFTAKQLVIATGFRRRIVQELARFDYEQTGKTIVFNTIGDSANLMISKLVPQGNRIICLHDGFVPVDKIMSLHGVTYTLDQLEFHNFGFHFRRTYRDLIGGGFCSLNIVENVLAKALQVTFLAPIFCRQNFQTRFGVARHTRLDQVPSTPVPNGTITVKYWPIDKYAEEFSTRLPEAIADGYLLNDIAFFASEGLVDFWPRRKTEIDRDSRTVIYDGRAVRYDTIIEADSEAPNLPEILFQHDGREERFEYHYRDNLFGVLPRKLLNVCFLGLTRPTTGGLANIAEMQCLLVHRMLTDDAFRDGIRTTLDSRLAAYNRSHYLQKAAGRTDHVVWYGSYVREVAHVIGIDIRLCDCRSLKDLNRYFFLPNNAFKFRQAGRYAVTGCAELADKIDREHRGYRAIHQYVLTFVLYRLVFFEWTVLLFLEGRISLAVFAVLAVFQVLFAKAFVIPTQNWFGALKLSYLAAAAVTIPIFGSVVFVPLILADFVLTFIMRQRGFRHLFNDLKNKRRYRGFFRRYRAAYLARSRDHGAV